jgi:D-alanyl-lipoteichoic acid acyltransferase DltB (MBOAT superfamily)
VTRREDVIEGSYLFYWGIFKKVVVADNLGRIVDRAFGDPVSLNSGDALVAVYAFAWQIYCDFSGYTDMARGCAKWFGFDLMINFRVPYLATDPSDFWQRWHISLSTWLRDYLYIPLGGSRSNDLRTYSNLMITMLLGGLWHGANWTFVIWGFYQGLLLIAYRLLGFDATSRSTLRQWLDRFIFFHLVCLGWLFFRAKTIGELTGMLEAFSRPGFPAIGAVARLGLAFPVFGLEYLIYRTNNQVAFLSRVPLLLRAIVYFGIYWALITLGQWNGEGFIYFQF